MPLNRLLQQSAYPLPRFLTTERHRVHPVLRRLLSTVRGAAATAPATQPS